MSAPLFWLCTPEQLPGGDAWLTPAERTQLAALRFARRRLDFRLGRFAAKRTLAALLGLPPEPRTWRSLDVPSRDGLPPRARHHGHALRVGLSLSHRAELGLAAVCASGALGCDVERVEPHGAAMVEQFFAPSERRAIARARDPEEWTALLWSAKESALKALGIGLAVDAREVVARAAPAAAEWSRLDVRLAGRSAPLGGWWRRLGPYVLTLVAEPPCAPPRFAERGAEARYPLGSVGAADRRERR